MKSVVIVKITENTKVVKSNTLIEARYKLTLIQQKIILLMASLINTKDEDFKFYQVPVKDIKKLLKIEDRKYQSFNQLLKDSVVNLIKTPLFIENKETGRWIALPWIASAEYIPGKGIIEFEFSEKLKPYLLQLKTVYKSYRLKYVINLRSTYSIRIYELLKQYEVVGNRKIQLDELKKKLGVDDKHKRYNNFKRKCLEVAKKELAEKSDISFDYKEITTARKVTAIDFCEIRSNVPADAYSGQISLDLAVNEGESINSPKSLLQDKIMGNTALVDRGVSPKQVEKLNIIYQDKKIQWKKEEYPVIDFYCEFFDWTVKNESEEKKPKGGAWLNSAIENQWQPPAGFKTKRQLQEEKQKKLLQKKLSEKFVKQENERAEKQEYLRWLTLTPEEQWNSNVYTFRFSFSSKNGKQPTAKQEREARKKYLENPETPEEYQIRRFGKVRYPYKNKK